jgi:Na+/H+ antiporter NhaD/arsenite permease-like protein
VAGSSREADDDHEPDPRIRDPRLLHGMGFICAFILIGFLTHGMTGMPAAVPAVIGAAAALILQDVLYLRRHQPSHSERVHGILKVLEHEIEWPTLTFFALLFMIVGAAVQTGLIGTLAHQLASGIHASRETFGLSVNGTLFFAAVLILVVAAVLSALIDNIPFVAVTIPIIRGLVGDLPGDTSVLWWALSLGACLGGNGSPIGASANVTTLDLAARRGHGISFADFTRFGATVVLITLAVSAGWLWLHVEFGKQGSFLITVAVFLGLLTLRLLRRPR